MATFASCWFPCTVAITCEMLLPLQFISTTVKYKNNYCSTPWEICIYVCYNNRKYWSGKPIKSEMRMELPYCISMLFTERLDHNRIGNNNNLRILCGEIKFHCSYLEVLHTDEYNII